jgi:hypothetical protein
MRCRPQACYECQSVKRRARLPERIFAAGVAMGALALVSLTGIYDLPPATGATATPPACSPANSRPPRLIGGTGADAATAGYAALLAPADAGADPRLLRTSLRNELELGGELGSRLDKYAPDGIRRLRQTSSGNNAVGYYYVPGQRARLFSAACLRKLPASRQKIVRAYERRFPPGSGYCLVGIAGGEAFPVECATLGAPPTGYAFGLARTGRNELVGMVPDGVATVRISYDGGIATSGSVSHNLFIAAAPAPATHELPCEKAAIRPGPTRRCTMRERLTQVRTATPLAVTWLGPNGAMVRKFILTPAYLRDAEETEGLTEPFLGGQ